MPDIKQLLFPAATALAVGFGLMTYDKMRGAEWVVSPRQIAEAKAAGQPGYESRPGTVTVLPIRSETADALPFKWAMAGIVAGAFAFGAMRRRAKAA
ncbi:hypothetical protein [Paracoccus binzhouensis]|uniref:hypothetical protein n=1 Tax=Paracoccus binzhouensis TaxID=2796149 RepID=UPI0018EF1E00|nr:hypothetical protein [Paracoccus binzhouensis]